MKKKMRMKAMDSMVAEGPKPEMIDKMMKAKMGKEEPKMEEESPEHEAMPSDVQEDMAEGYISMAVTPEEKDMIMQLRKKHKEMM